MDETSSDYVIDALSFALRHACEFIQGEESWTAVEVLAEIRAALKLECEYWSAQDDDQG
jgi:hypothetical protein